MGAAKKPSANGPKPRPDTELQNLVKKSESATKHEVKVIPRDGKDR